MKKRKESVQRDDGQEAREAIKKMKENGSRCSLRFKAHYFRFRDLTCEEQVTGFFGGGSEFPPRSRPLFLLFPKGAK